MNVRIVVKRRSAFFSRPSHVLFTSGLWPDSIKKTANDYKGTSPIRNCNLLGAYGSTVPRAHGGPRGRGYGGPRGGGLFLIS